jgi:hypothetical protein
VRAKAEPFAVELRDIVETAQAEGPKTLEALAVHLTSAQCQTPRGSAGRLPQCAATSTAGIVKSGGLMAL